MTTPGGFYPDDAITDGDLSSLDGLDQATWRDGLNGQAISPGYGSAHNSFNIFGGNIIGTIGGALFPSKTVGGQLDAADIADGQSELIGKIDALSDNAGFINLCMGHNWGIPNNQYSYPLSFDVNVTASKNAGIGHLDHFPGQYESSLTDVHSGATGIVFYGPGVWSMQALVNVINPGYGFRNRIFDVKIFEVSHKTNRDSIDVYDYVSEYSKTSVYFAPSVVSSEYGPSHSSDISAICPKRVVIPDNGKTYAAFAFISFDDPRVARDRKMRGGVVYSSLSATRQSVDTTVFNAPATVPDG